MSTARYDQSRRFSYDSGGSPTTMARSHLVDSSITRWQRHIKKTKKEAEEPAFAKGTGNVFPDLGLSDSNELFTRAMLGFL
jgi:hypothetical protein